MKDIIEFMRKRDYVFLEELGHGASGRTVLLHDDMIDELFVCKKYSPHYESDRLTLFENFKREIKLLHRVHHRNVVRVFNYYLYPEQTTGYILLEHIKGTDIEDYIRSNPERINELFLQAVDGFSHLESNNILHRDIRPANIMVREDGVLKIIDLGFGKHIQGTDDFDKSISLNWWCVPPSDFGSQTYDFRTEVYFVGKLFEQLITSEKIDSFQYKDVLNRMCNRSPDNRIASFLEVDREIQKNLFYEIEFTFTEKEQYRAFSSELSNSITKIGHDAKYIDDIDRVRTTLEDAYRGFMLEKTVPNAATVTRCFLTGTYHYRRGGMSVDTVRGFVHLLKSSPPEKNRVILANIFTKLDAIPRYDDSNNEEDIPF